MPFSAIWTLVGSEEKLRIHQFSVCDCLERLGFIRERTFTSAGRSVLVILMRVRYMSPRHVA